MKVIFFDGYCGLCNGFVDFVLKIDKAEVFKFSPLQSEFAKAHLRPEDIQQLKSVVVLIEGNTFRKAPAVTKVFAELEGGWKALSVLGILPSGILNFGYDLVAENRYRLFGKRETCRLPTPEERTRFIL